MKDLQQLEKKNVTLNKNSTSSTIKKKIGMSPSTAEKKPGVNY